MKGEIYGLGRNVNLFEDLRKIAYKDILKYKPNKTYDDFYHAMFSMAIMLNNYCNPTEPLSNNEIKQVCQSICKWTWRNFSQEQFSIIQAKRGTKNTGNKKIQKKNQIEKSTGDITMIINGRKIKAKDLAKHAGVSRSTVIKYYGISRE